MKKIEIYLPNIFGIPSKMEVRSFLSEKYQDFIIDLILFFFDSFLTEALSFLLGVLT